MGRRRRRSVRRPTFQSYRRPLRSEPLEERRLLAALTVTTNSDVVDFNDGVLSLREAIFVANTYPGLDEIEFDFGHDGPETIVLTQGELAIADSLTITGAGAALLTIDASSSDPTPEENNGDGKRVFNITNGNASTFVDVALTGLTITGGDVTGAGGGILSEENLVIGGCVVMANNATTTGGGISQRLGSFTLVASDVSHNRAAASGGGLTVSANNVPANFGKLTIRQSQIHDNTAVLDGGGIYLNQSSRLEIETSEIAGNTAARNGGGIVVASAGLGLSDSIVAENHAIAGSGGGIYGGSSANLQVLTTLVRANTASGSGGGVAMVHGESTIPPRSGLLLRDSMLSGNSAGVDGGGIFLTGGIHALLNSTLLGNSAGDRGGGVWSDSQASTQSMTPVTEMTQVTISGNQAKNFGGGVYTGNGMKISRSTVAENMVDRDATGLIGGGVYDASSDLGIAIDHTIIGNNRRRNAADDFSRGSRSQVRYSLIEVGSETGVGNMSGADPKLSPLQENGGPIFLDGSGMLTYALLADSPAIDKGDPTGGAPALAAAYRATVMGDVPSYYYRFEEMFSFETTAKDEMVALSASYSNSPTKGVVGAVPGGVAVEFDGVNDFVRSTSTSVSIGAKATVEIWARSATETWNASGWIARSDVRNLFVINPIQGTKSWSALLYDTTNVAHVVGTFTPDAAVDIREWHQFALSWDQTTGAATMYFDGAAVVMNTIGAALPQTTIIQLLSGWNDNSSTPVYGRGAVDELAVYNHVLSADAIAEHYAAARIGMFDQRGESFERVLDGDGVSGARIDIGAVERIATDTFTLVVDSLVDELDGDHSPGHFSLREAIGVAQGSLGTATIEFAPALTASGPATILLTQGELAIADTVVIHGPGAHLLTIDASGNDSTPNSTLSDGVATNDGDGSRVLNIDDKTAATLNVEIVGLQLTGGDANTSGGGIYARENLLLRECIVEGNVSRFQGGGIYSATDALSSNSLIVVDCAVSDNVAGNEGGGIRKVIGDMTVDRSVIDGNQAGYVGGGISAANGLVQVLIRDSVVSNNKQLERNTTWGGGGIFLYDAAATILNTSVVENEARTGAGIYAVDDVGTSTPGVEVTRIVNSTVSGNVGMVSTGIYSRVETEISHSTIVGNSLTMQDADVYSTLMVGIGVPGFNSLGFNLSTASATGVVGPLFGSGVQVFIDGSRMRVHALLPESPAIDTGNPADLAGFGSVPEFDQRGAPYGRVVDGNAVPGARIDIGAYERRPDEVLSFVVDTLEDDNGDDYTSGDRSLREAILLANAVPGVNTITFAPELTAGGPGRILLQYGEMAITESVVIDGPGADSITVDAQQSSRVFNITATEGDFQIDGLTLTHGKTTGNNVNGQTTYVHSGGAIRSMTTGTLTIDEARVMESGTTGTAAAGGGVFAVGPVVLNQSTVSGNTTAGEDSSGGGLASRKTVSATDSHVDNNRVTGLDEAGGGIWAVGNVSLTRSTVSGNQIPNADPIYLSAPNTGGGGVFAGAVNVVDSTVAENLVARRRGGGIRAGSIVVTGSTIRDNAAGTGGGVYGFSAVSITSSTVSGNSAGTGGGIYGNGVTVLNSTISGNVAVTRGGGIQGRGVTVLFSTITDNRAEGNNGDGGGVSAITTLTGRGSIIAGNSADGPGDDVLGQTELYFTLLGINSGATGSFVAEAPIGSPDARGNLIGGPVHGVIDPKLGPLAFNGGPTKTHALLPGSPAIDAGDPLAMAEMNGVPEFDQRGMPWGRVENGDDVPEARIDMGAVEWQANPLPGDYNFNGVVDVADYSVWRDTVGSTVDLRADGSSAATAGAPEGVVDEHDYAWWKRSFGNVIAQGAGSLEQGGGAVGEGYELQATEEIGTAGRASSGTQTLAGELRLAGVGEAAANASDDLVVATLELGSGTVQAGPARRSSPAVGTSRGGRTVGIDAALVAWLVRRGGGGLDDGDAGVGVDDRSADDDGGTESVDEAFAVLGERV